jgi:hypothetical protein
MKIPQPLGLIVGRNYLPQPGAGARRRLRTLFTPRELATAGCWILGAAAFGVGLGMMLYG